MKSNRTWSAIFLATVILLATVGSGCSTASVAVTEVLNDANCNTLHPGVHAGVHAVTLEDVARLKGRRMIGSITTPPNSSGDPQRLIAISRGEQPTAGYALELISASTATGDEIEIVVRFREPAADAVVAQMITQPCLILGLPDAATGPVSVTLDDGSLLGSLPAIQ